MPKSATKLLQSSSSPSRSTRSSRRTRPSRTRSSDADVRAPRCVTSSPARARSRLPPTHDASRSVDTSVSSPAGAPPSARARSTRCRASSPSWCSASSLVQVRCSRPKNVSSTPCPFTALALKTGSRPAARERARSPRRSGRVEIALVELDDERQLLEAQAEVLEVLAQVEERRRVVLGLADLRVGDEGDAVGALRARGAGSTRGAPARAR